MGTFVHTPNLSVGYKMKTFEIHSILCGFWLDVQTMSTLDGNPFIGFLQEKARKSAQNICVLFFVLIN